MNSVPVSARMPDSRLSRINLKSWEAVGAVAGPADPPVGDPADLQYDVGARRQMDTMWQEYGIEELEKGMQKLFPTFRISVTDLMTQIL